MSDPITRLNAALEGRYTIGRVLGEGGMATVYLADDLRHGRRVALKVLRPELAAVVGAERFLAEIKTTANLKHPHILPLFDSGEADGFLFYVMPYLEGESLRELIDREKQIPVEDAVAIASKVAGALQHAHEQGVIHRDIKPANILLQDREPVVADFGIALALGVGGGNRLTETGLSLGTPHYMSPEQVTGDQAVGAPTDTYALGSVLYEMLVGEPPYPGTTAQAVLGKIIAGKPVSAAEQRPSVPANVDAAIRKALEKLPADRFTSAHEFGKMLEDEHFRYGEQETAGVSASVGSWNRLTVSFAALAVVFGVAAGWGWFVQSPPTEPTPAGVPTLTRLGGPQIARLDGATTPAAAFTISPDGRWIVVQVEEEGTFYLYVRAAGDQVWRQLGNTEGGTGPTVSPDGQWVGFSTPSGIWKVPTAGGPRLPILASDNIWESLGSGTSHWGPDDVIVYEDGYALYRIGATGGQPELLLDTDTVTVRLPHLLPNGRAVVFSTPAFGHPLNSRILIYEIETGEVRELVASGNQPRYVPTGHLIYGHGDQTLMGVPFDLETLEVTGPPVTLLPELTVFINGNARFAISENGTMIYDGAADGSGSPRVLVDVDLEGGETVLPLSPGAFDVPRYSPDGAKIAFGDGRNIRVYDVSTGANLQLTTGGAIYPVWSSSGEYLFQHRRGWVSPASRRLRGSRTTL